MRRTAISVLLASTVLSGCQTDQSGNQQLGTVIGAIGGALLGSQIGNGKGQLLAVALGAIGGAYLGNEIGSILDEKEQQALNKETDNALSDTNDGDVVAWKNPDTGAAATITPIETKVVKRTVPMLRDKRVSAPVSLDLIGETYEATKSANVRINPTTNSKVIGGLQVGERFQAVGKVTGSNWIMVGKGQRTIGYVYGELVQKASAVKTAGIDLDSLPATDQQQPLRKAFDLDSLTKNEAIDLDKEGFVAEEVVVNQSCRTMKVDVSKGDKKADSTFKACKSQDGAWELI